MKASEVLPAGFFWVGGRSILHCQSVSSVQEMNTEHGCVVRITAENNEVWDVSITLREMMERIRAAQVEGHRLANHT